jgi:acetyl esterase
MNALPADLLQRIDAANLAGVRTVRAMMRRSLGARDRGAPEMRELRDFTIPGPAGDLEARFYRPHGAVRGGPALVFFHGGGFVIGDLDTNDAFVRRLAAASRVTMIAVQYRLAPEAHWPAPLEDALAATRWVIANATELGAAADRIGLSGDSAGAYLAIAVTAELNRAAPGTIAAQALIYPLLHVDDAVWKTAVLRDSRIVGRAAVAYIRAALAVPDGIPALHAADLPPAPPTLVVTGGLMDPIRPDARAYAEALRAAGVAVVTREYPALPHGFGSASHLFPASRAALAEIGQLAGQLLRSEG